MFIPGASETPTPLISDVPTLADTLRGKTGNFTWSLSHSVTANSGTSDKVMYFGVNPSQQASATGANNFFVFPAAVKIVGVVSTVSILSPGQGTKNPSEATMGLQNAETGEFFNFHIRHDYSKSLDIVRGGGKNIVVTGSDKFVIRVAIPGYSQSNPSNYTHQITLLLESLIPNVYYCGFEEGAAAVNFHVNTVPKKFSKYGQFSLSGNRYGLVGSYLIRPVLTKEYLTVYDNDPRGVGLVDPLVDPATVSFNSPPPQIAQSVSDELGIEFSTYPTLFTRPFFFEEGKQVSIFDQVYKTISAAQNARYVNYPGYTEWWYAYENASDRYRLGAVSLSMGGNSGPYNTPDSVNNGYVTSAFSFSAAKKSQLNPLTPIGGVNSLAEWYFLKVRVGILIDTVNDPAYCPDYISANTIVDPTGNTTANTFSEKLPKNGVPKLVVFEVDTLPNFKVDFSFWSTSGPNSVVAFSAVTFD